MSNFVLIVSLLDVKLKMLHRQYVKTDQKRNGDGESAQAFIQQIPCAERA